MKLIFLLLLPAGVAAAFLAGCTSSPPPYRGPDLQLVQTQPHVEPLAPARGPTTLEEHEAAFGPAPTRVDLAPYLQEASASPDAALVAAGDGRSLRSGVHHFWRPGTVYQVRTRPGFLTSLLLEPGERVISRAAGDTERWMVEETRVGEGSAAQVTLLVKPVSAPLATNLVVTTDRRLYQLELLADADDANAFQSLVAWTYPGGAVVPGLPAASDAGGAVQEAGAGAAAGGGNPIVANVGALDFDFAVRPRKPRRAPRWTPLRVFHDGHKTFIQFPPHVLQTEAPPLFVRRPGSREDELVNYRVVNGLYVVDTVFDTAVLKVGKDAADEVVIAYEGGFFGEAP
ncbi:TrbG/VirB9 family P-type conjugative transfer protein [Phycisphaera mikurensis]|uniref:Conjugal transfer protein TrbG n=1 Tax=Phycisphaera mikurensis (strain NBRC 102666 / KCTC 22515 / FYK2301M01) TaxID=1142394 RepID=I0IJI6_PHYMF|nr:TrbG/VirB9 family P-type conjugative transfer protein [Phycisphaera mikurensis]MBB6443174.1 type IV secretion system protein VirB9 [Phycisphaera mikurensis]BAM05424.1 conjugal transfer protein TrbG [Phycisphaera mikurensis NBRC 102666]